ncbi:MAG: hypothetical protein IT487_11155 [Chromatiaceae bacterium]|nr:hypothetical protein [Chromatiaceae bacterium]
MDKVQIRINPEIKEFPLFGNLSAGLVLVVIAALFVAMGIAGWPGLHWDASLFATPVINVATGKGWIFGGHTPALIGIDPPSYSIHGVIHVLVFGFLLQCDTWEKFLFWCGIVNATTFVAWTYLFSGTLRRGGQPGFFRPICLGLMAGVIAIGLQGRPEHLAPLLIALPLIFRDLGVPRRTFQIGIYATSGLLFITSPASGLLFGTGLVFWLSLKYERENNRQFWSELIVAGCIALVTAWCVVTLCCPFTFLEWFTHVFFSSSVAFDFSSHLFRFHPLDVKGISLDAPLWNVFVLATAALAAFTLLRRKKWIGLAIFTALMLYCVPRLTDYGYVAFFPCILLFFIGRLFPPVPRLPSPKGKEAILRLLMVLACIYALVFVRTTALAWVHVARGPSMAETRSQLTNLGAMAWIDQPIAVVFNGLTRPSFIVFGDGGERFISGRAEFSPQGAVDPDLVAYSDKFHRPIEFFIYPQPYRGHAPDVLFVGRERCELVYDGWTMEPPRLFGINLRGQMPGYQFALYRRTSL